MPLVLVTISCLWDENILLCNTISRLNVDIESFRMSVQTLGCSVNTFSVNKSHTAWHLRKWKQHQYLTLLKIIVEKIRSVHLKMTL